MLPRLRGIFFASSLLLLVVLCISAPAQAEVKPMRGEWWFDTWEIQQKVWPITRGDGITVGIVDTGVQADMPELAGVVVPGTDFQGGDGREDVERVAGGHGTMMAELVAAQGTGSGMLGIAPQAKILPVQTHTIGEIQRGIHYAVDHGAKVVNVSEAGGSASATECSPSAQAEVSYALEHDVVVVASAGNSGNGDNLPEEPASCPGVLTVGAVDRNLAPWVKTQRQSYVAVAAPGVDLSNTNVDREVQVASGTSGASALVSGAVALLRAKFPSLSAREIVQRLIASALDVGPAGTDQQTGAGFVRIVNALAGGVPKGAANPVFDRYDKWKADTEAQKRSIPVTASELIAMSFAVACLGMVGVAVLFLVRGRRGRRRTPVAPGQYPPPFPPPPPVGGHRQ